MDFSFHQRVVISLIPALSLTFFALWKKGRAAAKTSLLSRIAGTIFQCICLTCVAWCGVSALTRIAGGLILAGYSFVFAFDFVFFRITGQSPGVDMLSLGFREHKKVRHLARGFVRWEDLGVVIFLVACALLPVAFTIAMGWGFLLCGTGGLGALACAGAAGPRPGGTIHALCRLLWRKIKARGSHPEKPTRWRTPFPGRAIPGNRPNILTILNESLARDLCYGPGAKLMPAMQAFMRENARNVFDFPLALCNSTSSDISYPSILSGLSPNESWTRFERNPLIWAAAKTAGYATSFHSTWELDWGELGGLLVDEHLDLLVDPQALGEPLVNHMGMDDRVLTRHLAQHLENAEAPFFSVVACNAQHTPGLVDASLEGHDLKSYHGRYLNSLAVLDGCFSQLIGALQKSGKLENTVIFLMSDHGEKPSLYDNPGKNASASPRVDDFCHEVLSVPFWIYFPGGSVNDSQRAALRGNESQLVSNMDYYPTALAAMGIEINAADRESLALGGDDLTQPLPESRDIPCLNTGALRMWSTAPVSLAKGHELLIYHEPLKTFELLDLSKSSTTDLWPSISPQQKEMWMQRLTEAGLWPAPRYSNHSPEKPVAEKRITMELERTNDGDTVRSALLPVDIFRKNNGARIGGLITFDLAKANGHIIYGPYRWCMPGDYEAVFNIEVSGVGGDDRTRFVIEAADDLDRFLGQQSFSLREMLAAPSFCVTFKIPDRESRLELRVFASGFSTGTLQFSGVQLKCLDTA